MRCTCLADYWLWCFRDTVASFGFLNAGSLPFVGTNDIIRVFRQALSLDDVEFGGLGCETSVIRPIIFIQPSTSCTAS